MMVLKGPPVKRCFSLLFSRPKVAWLNYIYDGSDMATSKSCLSLLLFRPKVAFLNFINDGSEMATRKKLFEFVVFQT